MEPTESTFYKFNFNKVPLRLVEIEKKVYLIYPFQLTNKDFTQRKLLNLPKPGGYDSSTTHSNSDTRGEVTFEFSEPKTNPRQMFLDMKITTTCEYWSCGSLDDDWHPRAPAVERKRLFITMGDHNLFCNLEDIV